MDRPACVNVAAFPLQLLLKQHPNWKGKPSAVVDKDHPQGKILWVNQAAWSKGLRPGRRYSEALSLSADLRAAEISEAVIDRACENLVERLQQFSPEVEAADNLPGLCWVNARGLEKLYSSTKDWALSIYGSLLEDGFKANITVGFSRFGSYALALARRGVHVLDSPSDEQELVRNVHINRLNFDPKLIETLEKLGIRTIGTFMQLPAPGIRERFGEEAYSLHKMATGQTWVPLCPEPFKEPLEAKVLLEAPVSDVTHILFIVKRLLEPLLHKSAAKHLAVTILHTKLGLHTHDHLIETVRSAAPTLDLKNLLELLQLRLHTNRLPTGVEEIEIKIETTKADEEQLALFLVEQKQSQEAAARAFARLRAEYGEDVVVRATLQEGHLPEAKFSWEAMRELTKAHPRNVAVRPLVRRFNQRPTALPAIHDRNSNHWIMQGPELGSVIRTIGPYIVSGGWWKNTIHRDYYFVETNRGDLLWTYYDRRRRRWYLQGAID